MLVFNFLECFKDFERSVYTFDKSGTSLAWQGLNIDAAFFPANNSEPLFHLLKLFFPNMDSMVELLYFLLSFGWIMKHW